MTRQGETREGCWPPGKASYKWWPRASVARALALVGVLFLLPACSGPIGNMFAGILGAGSMYGGQAFLERSKEDVEAKREWRTKKREYVNDFASGMKFEAETHKRAGRFAEWKTVMADLLKFWDTQHPETLILELKRRAREADNDTGAQEITAARAGTVVPEAKMVAPAN